MIDRLIKENKSFALYRLPQENHIHFLMQHTNTSELIYQIEALNNANAYIMAPFNITAGHPIVLIRPDKEEILPIPEDSVPQEHTTAIDTCVSDNYKYRFTIFLNALKENKFDKLVLSRQKAIQKDAYFSPANAFYTACRKYIYSYVYICHTPQTGTWIGCTPEILLSGRNRQWQTVALAGTQPLIENKLPTKWDNKNKLEQYMVADYIRCQLNSYHIPFSENGPYTVRAGKLAHLKSEFLFQLPENHLIASLLNDLHPTPAICGLPKSDAQQFILENEGYDRSYYSGFIGRLQPDSDSDIYVNLRCMQILEKQLILYAGGGIMPSSSLEDEWLETENKLQTMLTLSKSNAHG